MVRVKAFHLSVPTTSGDPQLSPRIRMAGTAELPQPVPVIHPEVSDAPQDWVQREQAVVARRGGIGGVQKADHRMDSLHGTRIVYSHDRRRGRGRSMRG